MRKEGEWPHTHTHKIWSDLNPFKVTRLLEISFRKYVGGCFDLQFEINAGNVFQLPRRGLCCLVSWVIVTFDFRTLTCASSNEQKPNHTETSLEALLSPKPSVCWFP